METQIQQQSTSWHQWRSKGIGASDVPILLGVSPWKTPFQLWEEKTGRKSTDPSSGPSGNFATQRGQWLEAEARTQYELLADCDMPPLLVVHPEYDFMRASLDGYNAELRRVLEIKCPGKEDHKAALAGRVPEKYMPQVQYQIFVTGADHAHYFSYDGEQGCIVEVKSDPEMQARIVEAVKTFWLENVQKNIAPALSSRDKTHLTADSAVLLFTQYRTLKEQMNALEEKLEAVKAEIVESFGKEGRPMECAGVELSFATRKGSIDYSQIPALGEMDLEAYRKPSQIVPIIKLKNS